MNQPRIKNWPFLKWLKEKNAPATKRCYISGKITGIEKEAAWLFELAEREVVEKGYLPVNPFKINHDHDKSWRAYMRSDIKALCDCDAIYMLTNWRDSKGATIELEIANHLEMDVIYQHRRMNNPNK
jgi:hypothetical protein